MKIALLGDIAFFGRYTTANQSIYEYFASVSKLLKGYDYVIGNLETPFVTNQRPFGPKSAYIKSSPADIQLLKYLNVGIVNLSNNHIYDYGAESYLLTKKLLDENGIKYFGIEDQQLKIQKDANKLAFHGYCCYSTNPVGIYEGKYGVNKLNLPTVAANLKSNHEQGYNNIASIHCGQEHVNFANYDHVIMARQLAKICPYVFYGHHPHVMQGIEQVDGSLIAYSLGNFCFDDVYTPKSEAPLIVQSENNKTSFILELEYDSNTLINHRAIPIYLGEDEMQLHDNHIITKLNSYSAALHDNKDEYNARRSSILTSYISGRKQMRNLQWYLKRLNLTSVKMLMAARANSKKYYDNVSKHLNYPN